MGRWFQREAVAPQTVAEASNSTLLAQAELALEVDKNGVLIQASGRLAADIAELARGQSIQPCLASRTQLLAEEASDWRAGVVDVDWRLKSGKVLYSRGWLQSYEQYWLLRLVDMSDVVTQLKVQELRRQYLNLASLWAERLRSTDDGHIKVNAEGALEALAAQSTAVQAAWLVRQDDSAWSLFAQYSQYSQSVAVISLSAFSQAIEGLDTRYPSQQPANNRLGPKPAWLVPYQDPNGQAWLVFDGFVAEQDRDLRAEDWLQLAATLGSALLSRLNQQQQQAEQIRQGTVQELLGAGWWEYHRQTQEIEVAPSLLEVLPITQTRLSVEAWLEAIYPAERDEVRVHLGRLVSDAEVFNVSARFGTGAQARWYQIQGRTVGKGSRQRCCGLLVDIDEIKQQQANASAADARLRNLLGSAPAVVYVQRYHNGAWPLAYCSESLSALLGWELEDLAHGKMADQIYGEDLQIYFSRGRSLLERGSVSCRYRMYDKSGGLHWILDEGKLLRDAEGLPFEVVGVWLDVTEATLAAERIRESEERYRILVEDSPAMICRYTPDLVLNFANRPLATYLDTQPQLLIGANLAQWLSAEQQQFFEERLARLTPQYPLSTAEVCMSLPGRDYAWWVWSERGIFDGQGTLVEVQAVARDNTEVRRAQQQLMQGAKMATLGEMATGMAHEMNQPLNVMRMAVGNVLRKADQGVLETDYLREKLLRIEAQVERAAKIVNHMRVFGRRSEVEQQLFNPFDAVDGALSLLEEGLRSKGVKLVQDSWSGPLLQVRGFSDQLEQVLINLMVNACDAMLGRQVEGRCDQPRIELSAELLAERLHLYVQDNGGGIEPRVMERIFEPFFTTKEIGKGTGLGLSVSFGIVENMGGVLSVSNQNGGARFCIDLPLALDT